MSISTIASGTTSTDTSTTTQTLDKEDFLKLFITQLKNQNPLSPMDSTGFTSQLAQFSSLEQLTNLNSSMSSLVQYQNSLQNVMATSLIGKDVEAAGNQIVLSGTAGLNFTLPSATAKTTLSIYNSTGTCVRQVSLGAESAGNVSYTWDGKNNTGATQPDGQYTYTVTATDAKGASVTATTLMSGTVSGLAFESGTTYLVLNNGTKVTFSNITKIDD